MKIALCLRPMDPLQCSSPCLAHTGAFSRVRSCSLSCACHARSPPLFLTQIHSAHTVADSLSVTRSLWRVVSRVCLSRCKRQAGMTHVQTDCQSVSHNCITQLLPCTDARETCAIPSGIPLLPPRCEVPTLSRSKQLLTLSHVCFETVSITCAALTLSHVCFPFQCVMAHDTDVSWRMTYLCLTDL